MTAKQQISWEAEKIARIISGTWDWQGIVMAEGDAGLLNEVQAYLNTSDKIKDCGMYAIEQQQDADTSRYWICFDKKAAHKANRMYKQGYIEYVTSEDDRETRRQARKAEFEKIYGIVL
jgi:hypothetical protein